MAWYVMTWHGHGLNMLSLRVQTEFLAFGMVVTCAESRVRDTAFTYLPTLPGKTADIQHYRPQLGIAIMVM